MNLGLPRMRGKIDYTEVYNNFARQSTIHGINHSVQVKDNKKWQAFWLIAFLICLCCLTIQVILLLMKYVEYPKTVDLDVGLFYFKKQLYKILILAQI